MLGSCSNAKVLARLPSESPDLALCSGQLYAKDHAAMTIEMVPLRPKIIVNGFPKSGTHLAIRIAAHLAQKQEPKHWIGTFAGHSWSDKWIPWPVVGSVMNGQPEGTWMMGHMGYDDTILEALNQNRQAMLFIYRDLRDVAVSQAYHIENADNKESGFHPGKDLYMALPDHQARIQAVITGLGEWPGLFERWKYYEPWLKHSEVFPIRYEDMINDPGQVAMDVLNYVTLRSTDAMLPIVLQKNFSEAVDIAIKNMIDKGIPGIRAGRVGDWRFEFTDETEDLFNQKAGGTLERLGHESD